MFTKLDTDNDGVLSMEELEAGMQEVCDVFHLDPPDLRAMFKASDTNGNGTIDYTEFIAAAFKKDVLLSRKNLEAAFKMLDLDNDGHISKDELR